MLTVCKYTHYLLNTGMYGEEKSTILWMFTIIFMNQSFRRHDVFVKTIRNHTRADSIFFVRLHLEASDARNGLKSNCR